MSPMPSSTPAPTTTTMATQQQRQRHQRNHQNKPPVPVELCGGCVLRVNDRRAVIDLPPHRDDGCDGDGKGNEGCSCEDDAGGEKDASEVASDGRGRGGCQCGCGGGWTVLSSAVLNGGLLTLARGCRGHVLNAGVPADYDGVDPDPGTLLRRMAADQGLTSPADRNNVDDDSPPSKAAAPPDVVVIGLLTAASMRTIRTANRSAGGVSVDAVVTAGLSNARAVGVDADCFLFGDERDEAENERGPSPNSTPPAHPAGTINTVVVTDARLTPSALMEAYAIAVEARCAACAELGVPCAKLGSTLAQGTGTDATVLVARSMATTKAVLGGGGKCRGCNCDSAGRRVTYAGKHCLFAELLGQAVREATREAILTNIRHMHGNRRSALLEYTICNRIRAFFRALACSSRPCVPPRPGMPVPWPPASAVVLGSAAILSLALPGLLFGLDPIIPRRARVLLAAVAWDRYLGEPPVAVHPVVLVGNLISAVLCRLPAGVFSYDNPVLGFVAGAAMCVVVLASSVGAAWLVLFATGALSAFCVAAASAVSPADLVGTMLGGLFPFLVEVVIMKSTVSPRLLCTVALQMAHHLERHRIAEARTQLSWLCSRDPSNLDSGELAGATLESLSENLSDGLVAPLFWYAVGAAWGCFSRGIDYDASPAAIATLAALAYRTANTLDSRVGYRDRGFEYLGKFSARLDDVVNWIPARLTALCLALAASLVIPGSRSTDAAVAAVVGGRRAMAVAWGDCAGCDSPNAGWPMGAMAGSLGVTLEKRGQYRLNGGGRRPGPWDIRTGERVARLAGRLAVLVAVGVVSMACLSCPHPSAAAAGDEHR